MKKTNETVSPNECVAIIFPNLKMHSSSSVIKNITAHLEQNSIECHVASNQTIQENVVNFKKLEMDENLIIRLVNEISQILDRVDEVKRKNVILIGLSAGARFMASYALANKLGLTADSSTINITGLIGINLSTSLRLSKPTPADVSELKQINPMDYNTNLGHIDNSLIYDVFVDRDSVAFETADARKQRYKNQGLNAKQCKLEGCDFVKTRYYEKKGNEYFLYTEVSAHNLQNAYIMEEDESFTPAHQLHGSSNAPIESTLDQFLVEKNIIPLQ